MEMQEVVPKPGGGRRNGPFEVRSPAALSLQKHEQEKERLPPALSSWHPPKVEQVRGAASVVSARIE